MVLALTCIDIPTLLLVQLTTGCYCLTWQLYPIQMRGIMSATTRTRAARRARPPIREVWMIVIDPGKLQRRRKAKGLTQMQLSIFARCTQQYISILESGRDRDCSEDIALRVSKALDVDLEDYFEARELTRNPPIATDSRGGSAA